ncbi:hypothetical protein FRACYDRAFT_235524 [Fragilariopsis cylindrus CCMP1102]|uniref:TAFII55 protein conserved region domain-containing protein n=1 Tax=Fragilariopsis cylindrus CCMP1102 TaxID=635003 RepID=A0A1E7FMS9_9STRA|nr:hypothetical protein FRACYDRAFT_235524 [Fragilariopsis cylindrus CCMP1102]|eukprot:OEU19470.1 hypothetical protein FRACYDRAFT_235524 [Fragilariopsis cylindrus CCMP1102]
MSTEQPNSKGRDNDNHRLTLQPRPSSLLSQDQIDQLLKVMTTTTTATAPTSSSSSSSSSSHQTKLAKLKGRDVLIPFNKIAFYEGELNPETILTQSTTKLDTNDDNKVTNVGGNKGDVDDDGGGGDGEVEIVYVNLTTETTASTSSSSSNCDNNLHRMTVPDTINWLRSSSSSLKSTSKPKPKPTSTLKPKEINVDGRENKNSSNRRDDDGGGSSGAPIPSVSVFNIQEEYTADGKCVFGKAVDLSARIQHVYGKNGNGDGDNNENDESKSDDDDVSSDKCDSDSGTDTVAADIDGVVSSSKKKEVSDEEYDRIAKRLDELALLEQQEANMKGRRPKSKPLGSTSSGFGFKKGFLNNNNNSSSTNKKKKKKQLLSSEEMNATSNSRERKISSSSSVGGGDRDRVTIDTSKNKIREIPREGNQQPLPIRKTNNTTTVQNNQQQQQQHQQQQHNTRMLDRSIFSGQISERKTNNINTTTNTTPVIISETTASTPTSSATTTQEVQEPMKKKRVSRFKQQLQQE